MPLLLDPLNSDDPDRYTTQLPFWSRVRKVGTLLTPKEGVLESVLHEANYDVKRAAKSISRYFSNLDPNDVFEALKDVAILIALAHRLWSKIRRPPEKWDDTHQQDEALRTVQDTLKAGKPAEGFLAEAKRFGESTPQWLLYNALGKHLSGRPAEAAKLLRDFSRRYLPTNARLHELIQLRLGKALTGAGALRIADRHYRDLAEAQTRLARLETIREQGNVQTILAWSFPDNVSYTRTLAGETQ